ncbi:MAG: hypothetical protein EBS38_03820 [Actinobacteria bacterium]|nr:hypothetical protein [Actinomycetota bacterium]
MKLLGLLAIGFALSTGLFLLVCFFGGLGSDGHMFGMLAFSLFPIYLTVLCVVFLAISIAYGFQANSFRGKVKPTFPREEEQK